MEPPKLMIALLVLRKDVDVELLMLVVVHRVDPLAHVVLLSGVVPVALLDSPTNVDVELLVPVAVLRVKLPIPSCRLSTKYSSRCLSHEWMPPSSCRSWSWRSAWKCWSPSRCLATWYASRRLSHG